MYIHFYFYYTLNSLYMRQYITTVKHSLRAAYFKVFIAFFTAVAEFLPNFSYNLSQLIPLDTLTAFTNSVQET